MTDPMTDPFLDARPYVKGHTILSAKKTGDICPQDLSKDLTCEQLATLGIALQNVSQAIKNVYKIVRIKDILFASLRGKIKHFHFHLIPLYEEKENQWRLETLYEKGHLFEYLGKLEKDGVEHALRERIEKGWNEEKQREENTKDLTPEVESLKKETGYQVVP